MLVADKKIVLNAFMRMAKKRMMDKDYLLTKLQALVTDGDVTEQDIQPIINVIVPKKKRILNKILKI